MNTTSLPFTLVWPRVVGRTLLAIGFALLIGLGAHLKVYLPFTPVPITFQTLFLLIGASFLRRFYSLQMVGWYLFLGFLGLPFFAAEPRPGLLYLLGPTGGYLFGFVLTAVVLGFLQARRSWFQFLLFLFAHTVLFIPGVTWLKVVTHVSWGRALEMGFYPFLIGDLLKSGIAFSAWFLTQRK